MFVCNRSRGALTFLLSDTEAAEDFAEEVVGAVFFPPTLSTIFPRFLRSFFSIESSELLLLAPEKVILITYIFRFFEKALPLLCTHSPHRENKAVSRLLLE